MVVVAELAPLQSSASQEPSSEAEVEARMTLDTGLVAGIASNRMIVEERTESGLAVERTGLAGMIVGNHSLEPVHRFAAAHTAAAAVVRKMLCKLAVPCTLEALCMIALHSPCRTLLELPWSLEPRKSAASVVSRSLELPWSLAQRLSLGLEHIVGRLM